MNWILKLSIGLMLIFLHCSQPTGSEYPEWIDELIEEFKSQPVGNPPQSIWQYQYDGRIVYYVPPQCCDQYSQLYESNGRLICAPGGGISGSGDGKCPDFFLKSTQEKLVWKDERER